MIFNIIAVRKIDAGKYYFPQEKTSEVLAVISTDMSQKV